MTYYNTNKETGGTLVKSRKKTQSQEDIIKSLFFGFEYKNTPERVHNIYFTGTPLTSIRRAFSNLVKEGFLIKTDKMTKGMYGKQIHYYARAKN